MDEISRMEKILRGDPIEPITRLEIFCAMAAGTWSGDPLTPVTRLEYFLSQISGGGGGVTLSTLIPPVPSFVGYTGQLDYSTPSRQQFAAPEGVAYDKVWNSDQYITSNLYATNIKKFVASGKAASYRFAYTGAISICLTKADVEISQSCFYYSDSLKKVAIYRTGSVAPLANVNAFVGTPFASGGSGGTLYVPAALIPSYQSATNWSTILGYANNSIQAIEGSEFQA